MQEQAGQDVVETRGRRGGVTTWWWGRNEASRGYARGSGGGGSDWCQDRCRCFGYRSDGVRDAILRVTWSGLDWTRLLPDWRATESPNHRGMDEAVFQLPLANLKLYNSSKSESQSEPDRAKQSIVVSSSGARRRALCIETILSIYLLWSPLPCTCLLLAALLVSVSRRRLLTLQSVVGHDSHDVLPTTTLTSPTSPASSIEIYLYCWHAHSNCFLFPFIAHANGCW